MLVIGAGAAGLNAALEAKLLGLNVVLLEKTRIGSTVADLPAGKWIYTEPYDRPVMGSLTLKEMTKEELVLCWENDVKRAGLDVRLGVTVTGLTRDKAGFNVVTTSGTFRSATVVLAIGKSGNPRKLLIPGEELPHVEHKLYQPRHYRDQTIAVIGGGNSALEAAISLSEQNKVILIHRGGDFARASKDNVRRLHESPVEVRANTKVKEFRPGSCLVDGNELRCDRAFVLIGSDAPREFLHSMGLRLENEWRGNPLTAALLGIAVLGGFAVYAGHNTAAAFVACAALFTLLLLGIRGNRFALLAFSCLTAYSIYGAKQATGHELWPFTGWGFAALSLFHRPWSFWYTVLYTGVMTVFGIKAMKRWGFDRKDRFQVWRYASLLGFQWIFFFLIPEFLFQWAVRYQWVGAKLAADPDFGSNAWRSYGFVYAWPLFFYTFFGSPHQFWLVWGALLSFVIIPVLVLFHGKRYCSWICGCGGLAETLGDRWRHLLQRRSCNLVGADEWNCAGCRRPHHSWNCRERSLDRN